MVVEVVDIVVVIVGSGVDVITAAKSEAFDCDNNFSIEIGVVDGVNQPVNSVLALEISYISIY